MAHAAAIDPHHWTKTSHDVTSGARGCHSRAVHIVGTAAMFAAYRYLPLADALAIAFVYPFIMLLMGWALLKEKVGVRRLVACTVGFIGTLLIVQPSFAAVEPRRLYCRSLSPSCSPPLFS